MKFARYLEDTLTPEWKRAYIDYRKLKKLISAIRKAQLESPDAPGARHASPNQQRPSQAHAPGLPDLRDGAELHSSSITFSRSSNAAGSSAAPSRRSVESSVDGDDAGNRTRRPVPHVLTESRTRRFLRRSTTFLGFQQPTRNSSLRELTPFLSPAEAAFFTLLDAERDKVESFYLDREKEYLDRSRALEEQLRELDVHRRLFHAAYPGRSGTRDGWLNLNHIASDVRSRLPSARMALWRNRNSQDMRSARHLRQPSHSDIEETRHATLSAGSASERDESTQEPTNLVATSSGVRVHAHDPVAATLSDSPTDATHILVPDAYLHAKKKLKTAVLEHYRGLEVLNNYRILNITGFRKALKKFEKVTKITIMEAYMKEKVETSAFASGNSVYKMTKEMEDLFTARFEHGDKKKAMDKLRVSPTHTGHYASTFRSGLFLGLAAPALASGLYEALQQEAHVIPGSATLLFIYAVFAVPVLFSVLVGLNILVWTRSRINYVFIFELEVRTRLDGREYFEIPAFFLVLLAYAFWLSFHRIGSHVVDPTTWPLIWLGFVVFFMINPLPIWRRSSRWWFLKSTGRLLISGMTRVEFTDFWLGDQFCSLVFTLSNLYFVGCVYRGDFFEGPQRCTSLRGFWPITFLLSAFPLWMRLVQSVRRYADSRLITHLINGGKYGAGIIYYLLYCIWRHQGRGRRSSLALWCLSGTVYAVYASSWDILMDWSVLKPRAANVFLRPELLYTNHVSLYYFAIVTNVLLRFSWLLYVPTNGPSMALRSFVAGILEILRRLQWNFYRVENEQLGNMDQYRVTREVPLPYSLDHDDPAHLDGGSSDGNDNRLAREPNRSKQRGRTVTPVARPTSGAIGIQ